jgi:uncharacterized membrane protein
MPVSDILTAIVSAIIIAITYKQLDTGKEKETQKNKESLATL